MKKRSAAERIGKARQLFAGESAASAIDTSINMAVGTTPKRVFIVYGHDVDAREQLEP